MPITPTIVRKNENRTYDSPGRDRPVVVVVVQLRPAVEKLDDSGITVNVQQHP